MDGYIIYLGVCIMHEYISAIINQNPAFERGVVYVAEGNNKYAVDIGGIIRHNVGIQKSYNDNTSIQSFGGPSGIVDSDRYKRGDAVRVSRTSNNQSQMVITGYDPMGPFSVGDVIEI
jgi:hypothetical protein